MALDALGRVIVGSGHFAATAAPMVAQGIQAISAMRTSSEGVARNITVGGGHLSQISRPIEAIQSVAIAGGAMHIHVGQGHFLFNDLNTFWTNQLALEDKLGDAIFSQDPRQLEEVGQLLVENDKKFLEMTKKTKAAGLDMLGKKLTNEGSLSRLNFPHTIRNGTVRIAGDDRAWEAYQAYLDSQNEHLRNAARETALALLSEAAGDPGGAIEHAGMATVEIAQSVWESWKRDYERIRDAITQPSYDGFGIPDRDR